MRLRFLIEGRPDPKSKSRSPATVATVATVRARSGASVATVATVASPSIPESWLVRLRAQDLAGLPPSRWIEVADALEALLQAGVVGEALKAGWDARQIVGVQTVAPHDHPSRAGLVFSLRPGDVVRNVRPEGCVIAYGRVQHVWRRTALPIDGSIVMPWELA